MKRRTFAWPPRVGLWPGSDACVLSEETNFSRRNLSTSWWRRAWLSAARRLLQVGQVRGGCCLVATSSCTCKAWLLRVGLCLVTCTAWLLRVGLCLVATSSWSSWLLRAGLCLMASSSWLLRVGLGLVAASSCACTAWLLRVGLCLVATSS